jgi:anti-anti-sigma factor
MEIIQREKNGIVCVIIKGRIEAGLAPEFEKAIQEIIAKDRRHLLFDLSALEYLRSSVLRVILNAIKEINHKSGRVVLCCLNGYVKEIFEVNRFKDTITITDSVESGLMELSCGLKAA